MQFLVAAAMVPLFGVIYYLAYWLRFEGDIPDLEMRAFVATAGLVLTVKLAVFVAFGAHQGWGRLVTFYDLILLGKATTASLVGIVLVDRFLFAVGLIPRSIYLLDWGATIVAVGGLRSVLRGFREYAWASLWPSTQIPTLIVGANDAGELLLRALIREGRQTYRVLGFIDQDARRLGTRIAGVPILGSLDQTCALAERYGVRTLLVAQEGISGQQIRKLVEEARHANLEIRVLPSYGQLLSGKVSIQPRAVSIDDLLRRDPVTLDLASIRRWIDGRVLLITGSAGSIGSEICRQLLQFAPQRLVLVDRWETGQFFLERELRRLGPHVEVDLCLADVLDRPRMHSLLRRYRPQVIFHAAAYKHVPLMESQPGEAVKNIVAATRQLADLAVHSAVDSFVMISTDKAVCPTSVMGACKRAAELYVQALAERSTCRFVTVRFGNVLDSAGSVVPIFRQQIADGGPVTVTHPEVRRYFMTIPEAAKLVIQAGAIGQGGHILLLDMGEPVRIVDLAEDMIRLSGLRVGEDVAIAFVGMRPGEKLSEQLRLPSEKPLPTCHPKIIIADHQPADFDRIAKAIDELIHMADGDPEPLLARLRRLVPEYQTSKRAERARRAAA